MKVSSVYVRASQDKKGLTGRLMRIKILGLSCSLQGQGKTEILSDGVLKEVKHEKLESIIL
jgi:hypothetical protein